jgi:NAD+ synthase (glutamine-hydrolysing)
VIANLSATDETIGKDNYRRLLARSQSGRAVCAYIYTNAGHGESTGDAVFSGHSLICENAELLAERRPFEPGIAITDIDIGSLVHDRRCQTNFPQAAWQTHRIILFSQVQDCGLQYRYVSPHPFVPKDARECAARCEKILKIQAAGLMHRMDHIGADRAVLGLSGGLDSTLTLLVCASAMHKLGLHGKNILAVSMPGPGTSFHTRENARALAQAVGVGFREIPIDASVRLHLQDIGHPENELGTVFENAQARIRTLILMDLANKCGGLVVGTGDMSELALGWTTYNGDQMSMYGVNAGVPKTLVSKIIEYIADLEPALSGVLHSIIDTPVSPELLPPQEGQISQKTESILGPYELHDFFLYHAIRRGRPPALILKLAVHAFAGKYPEERVRDVMRTFYKRFFAHQFKRNALPDGPKIGTVSLAARTDWRMPSDADGEAWMSSIGE